MIGFMIFGSNSCQIMINKCAIDFNFRAQGKMISKMFFVLDHHAEKPATVLDMSAVSSTSRPGIFLSSARTLFRNSFNWALDEKFHFY
jgi:hypothetical protein